MLEDIATLHLVTASIAILNITTLRKTTFSIMTLGIMNFSTPSPMTINIKYTKLNDTQH